MFDEYKDIFQYGPPEYLNQVLTNNTIGFSSLKDFNDPFESHYSYSHFVKKRNTISQYLQDVHSNPVNILISKIRGKIDKYLNDLKVSCFSKNPYEPLMWSHYSKKHEGICYCYDNSKLFNIQQYQFKKVVYSNEIANIIFFEEITSFSMLKPQIESIICTKSENWAYEKEYRYIIKSEESAHKFNVNSLKAIIVGFRHKNITLVEKMIQDYNNKNNTEVKILYARPSSDLYKINILPNKQKTNPGRTFYQYDDKDKPIA
ncbi:hypothetical protein KCTC52924_03619 [Arenibacter antarcticus]